MTDRTNAAAQYLRMSTDQQDLSLDAQTRAIAAYAAANGLRVIASYEDSGKSGLRIANRESMKRLLADVTDAACPFSTVLVYDVSRWGRFQNTDASAYYDYHCRLHGVTVVYVAESFGAEVGPYAALIKSLKRAMAAEYSRELGVKTRAGQERVVGLGYSAGGQPAIGLVRQAVTREGRPRMILARNERKSVQSDRIRLVPGPAAEIALLRRIFDLYANTATTMTGLVRQLAAEGHLTRAGRPFTLRIVDSLLTYEPFIGNYVWPNLERTPQGMQRVPPEKQLRSEGSIPALIDRDTWDKVQAKRRSRLRPRRAPERLITELAQALKRRPELSGPELSAFGCAPSQTYTKTFGSMEAAYALASRTYEAAQANSIVRARRTNELTRALQAEVVEQLRRQGHSAEHDLQNHTIDVDQRWRIQVQLVQKRSHTQEPAWFIQRRRVTRSDFRLLARMNEKGALLDFFFVPDADRGTFPTLLRDEHMPQVRRYRVKSLDRLSKLLAFEAANRPPPPLKEPRRTRPKAVSEDRARDSDRAAWIAHLAWCKEFGSDRPQEVRERVRVLIEAQNFYAVRLRRKSG